VLRQITSEYAKYYRGLGVVVLTLAFLWLMMVLDATIDSEDDGEQPLTSSSSASPSSSPLASYSPSSADDIERIKVTLLRAVLHLRSRHEQT